MKTSIDQLAVLGGAPAFAEPLHVGRPNVGDRAAFAARLDEMFDRHWLTNDGVCVRELESRIANFLGVRHCMLVCNGTVALQVMAAACGMTGEVIMPSFTFIATAHALAWQGVKPVFCDVDPATHNIDPAKVESLITDATTGILGVHVWGRACDVDALDAIARRRGLVLAFDAAHAFACSHQGRMIGGFGSAETFSFHATKFFNSFEGGAITTNDDAVAERCRLMRNFGFSGLDHVVSLGLNGKMSEASAAMGLTNLDSLSSFIEVNARNYAWYREGLGDIPGLQLADYRAGERSNFQYVVVEVDPVVAGLTRDDLSEVLHAENVLARRYFYPGCHCMAPYEAEYCGRGLLPATEQLTKRTLSLPTGTSVDEDDIRTVSALIRLSLGESGALADRMGWARRTS